MDQRPLGLTILAVLSVIGGLFGLLGGLAVVLDPLALLSVAQGVLSFGVAFGFWTLARWGWPLGLGVAGLGIALDAIGLLGGNVGHAIGIAIYGAIVWYLMRPSIKAVFGR